MLKKKIILFIFINLIVSASYGGDDNVLIAVNGLKITEQDLIEAMDAQPAEQRELLHSNVKKLNQYIDVYYRERLFEQLAFQQKIDQTPEYKAMLGEAKRRLLVSLVVDKKKESIVVPNMTQAAREFYQMNADKFFIPEQIEVRHILLKSKQDDPDRDKVQQRLASILLEIKQDPSQFEALAKKYSEDGGSAAKGGVLTKFSKGRMVEEFEREAFNLNKPGELSGVFSTKYGFHIIQLIKKTPATTASFEQSKSIIIDKLSKDYIEEEYMRWRGDVIDPTKAQVNQEQLQKFVQKMVAEE